MCRNQSEGRPVALAPRPCGKLVATPLPPPPVNREGELVMTSQRHRTQESNLEDAFAKLAAAVKEAAVIPKVRACVWGVEGGWQAVPVAAPQRPSPAAGADHAHRTQRAFESGVPGRQAPPRGCQGAQADAQQWR